jgi:hypothetical protein
MAGWQARGRLFRQEGRMSGIFVAGGMGFDSVVPVGQFFEPRPRTVFGGDCLRTAGSWAKHGSM